MGLGNGSGAPDPVYHCTRLPRKHQAADVPWTLWVRRMVCESTKKINNDGLVSSWVNEPNRLETAWYAWRRNASLKSSAITELNQLSNTMNMTTVLQGQDPPPLFKVIHNIWNVFRITHYRIERIVQQHGEFSNCTVRGWSTRSVRWWQLDLKGFMQTNYTSNGTVMASQLHGSDPITIVF